jgi:acetyl esterase/lipase
MTAKNAFEIALLSGFVFACGLLGAGDLSAQTPAIAPVPYTYREVEGKALKAYVFSPPGSEQRKPAVLLFHGGAWQLGDASWMFDRARDFAKHGMVAIAVDYRLSVDGRSPIEAVEDACAAFAWVRQHAEELHVDVKRVAGYGVSAGGHLVASAATLPAVKGVPLSNEARPNAMMLYSPALNVGQDPYFTRLMNGHGDPRAYSPSAYISHALPPTLIIQGKQDSIVFAKDAQEFCASARRSAARCELHVYPGVGHLLTRNLAVQYKDFDSDPADATDAHRLEDAFMASLGYVQTGVRRSQ